MPASGYKQKRREARRERRFRRRLVLFGLLACAVSPSLFALYYTAQQQQQPAEQHNAQHQLYYVPNDSLMKNKSWTPQELQRAADRLAVDQNPFVPPEQKDPNFGLPQIIVHHPPDSPLTKQSSSSSSTTIVCQDPLTGPCCAPWTSKTDDWWTRRIDWQIAHENKTHTCFSKIMDAQHLDFLQSLDQRQWQTHDCETSCVQSPQISSGYAAALSSIARAFYASYQQGHAYQYNQHAAGARWNFASNDTSHWAYCPSQDMQCYFLPLGGCPPIVGLHNAPRGNRQPRTNHEYRWLRQYAFRPRHSVRQQLMSMINEHATTVTIAPNNSTPCTVIHVRRTDIAFGKGRRYLPVQAYLTAGTVARGATVVVLTDDSSTIDEIEQYHMGQYNWVYLHRPRFRGPEGGFEGFIPSKDPASEVLAIMAELQMASQCQTLVHGKSGFVEIIQEAMMEKQDADSLNFIYLDNQQDKASQPKLDPQVRANQYLEQILQKNEGGTS